MRYGGKEQRSAVRNDWARTMSKMRMILVAGSLALVGRIRTRGHPPYKPPIHLCLGTPVS